MRTFLALCIVLFLGNGLYSQGCSKYYPMEEGTSFQYTNYNKKGKSDGTVDYTVADVSTDGAMTSATMLMKLKDNKGKEILQSDYKFSCSENVVRIDYQSLMSNQMLMQSQDGEMEISGNDIEIPNDLGVGQELADANVTVKLSMSGINMNMSVNMINRKVEKKESITTPAGTFDCFVLYSENETKVMMKQTFPSRIWLAEGVGMVKQESYNKNGKLMGSTQLTAFNK
ncbi:MAG: hypothetical protein AB3N14_09995 [Flavobacteriaceae bacterium]